MKDSFGVEMPSTILDDPELGKLAGIKKIVKDHARHRHLRWVWRGRNLDEHMAVYDRNRTWALATAMRGVLELGASHDHPLEISKMEDSHNDYPWPGAGGFISVVYARPDEMEDFK